MRSQASNCPNLDFVWKNIIAAREGEGDADVRTLLSPDHRAFTRFVDEQVRASHLPFFFCVCVERCTTCKVLYLLSKAVIGWARMPWLRMSKFALRLKYLWLYLDGEQVWSSLVKVFLLQLTSLLEISPWVKQRFRLGD